MSLYAQEYRYDTLLLNKKGELDGLHTWSHGGELDYTHLYKDGVLVEAMHYNVIVNGQRPLKGTYRNGQPFQGYFVDTQDKMELNITHYFEEGKQVAQYSRPLDLAEEMLDYDDEDRYKKAPFKTTFKDGKIWDGVRYAQYSLGEKTFLLATENYKEGKRQDVDMILGAIHFAEMFKLLFLADGYSLESGGNYGEKGKKMVVQFTTQQAGKVTLEEQTFDFYQAPVSKPFQRIQGQVQYFSEDKQYFYQHTYNGRIDYDAAPSAINIPFRKSILRVPQLTGTAENDYSFLFDQRESSQFSTMLILLKDAEPYMGTWIEQEANGTYRFRKYKNYKQIDHHEHLSFDEIEQKARWKDQDYAE